MELLRMRKAAAKCEKNVNILYFELGSGIRIHPPNLTLLIRRRKIKKNRDIRLDKGTLKKKTTFL